MRLAGQTGWRTAWTMRAGLGVFWDLMEVNEMSILLNEKEKYQRRWSHEKKAALMELQHTLGRCYRCDCKFNLCFCYKIRLGSVMDLSLAIVGGAIVFLLIFCLPLKIKLLKKNNWELSNDEMIAKAKKGDVDAKRLLMRTKIIIVATVICACLNGLQQIFSTN
jgi:hypothetical protein